MTTCSPAQSLQGKFDYAESLMKEIKRLDRRIDDLQHRLSDQVSHSYLYLSDDSEPESDKDPSLDQELLDVYLRDTIDLREMERLLELGADPMLHDGRMIMYAIDTDNLSLFKLLIHFGPSAPVRYHKIISHIYLNGQRDFFHVLRPHLNLSAYQGTTTLTRVAEMLQSWIK